jgi:hypothetical protein
MIVNVNTGELTPDKTEAIEFQGRAYARQYDGSLRPLDAYGVGRAGEYLSSAWHNRQADACLDVAEQLARRAEELVNIRAACLAKSEVVVNV